MTHSIETVKQKHEVNWIRIPGVEGVGIGEEDGTEVIVVYLSTPQKPGIIPTTIEGFRVVTHYVGEFTSL